MPRKDVTNHIYETIEEDPKEDYYENYSVICNAQENCTQEGKNEEFVNKGYNLFYNVKTLHPVIDYRIVNVNGENCDEVLDNYKKQFQRELSSFKRPNINCYEYENQKSFINHL